MALFVVPPATVEVVPEAQFVEPPPTAAVVPAVLPLPPPIVLFGPIVILP